MNAQDKAEALRLIQEADEFCPLALSVSLTELRALIERQPDDTDGEMWRFCVEHGFPQPWGLRSEYWAMQVNLPSEVILMAEPTAESLVSKAMAMMKEKKRDHA